MCTYPDSLQAYLVPHGAAQALCALLCHPLGHGDGRDAAGLGAEDVGNLIGRAAQRLVQNELRNLGGFTTPIGFHTQSKTK